jgi:hypothetical protein
MELWMRGAFWVVVHSSETFTRKATGIYKENSSADPVVL